MKNIKSMLRELSERFNSIPWGDWLTVCFLGFVVLIIIINAIGGGGDNNAYGY